MKHVTYTVESSRQLTGDVFEVVLTGDTSAITVPGQFVNLDLPGFFLRRPISVCDWEEGRLTLLVKVAGRGTELLVHLAPGWIPSAASATALTPRWPGRIPFWWGAASASPPSTALPAA